MKLHFSSASLLVLAALLSPACKSADKGSTTGDRITTTSSKLDLGARQLESTVAALDALIQHPAPDLKPQRTAYEDALDDFSSTVKELKDSAAGMMKDGDAFMVEWDQQVKTIQNEDIREQSDDRRKAVEASFSKAKNEYGETKGDLDPLMQNLEDIRTALKADLTMNGIKSLESPAKKVRKQADSVGKSMKELSQRFAELSVEFSRNGPPETKPK
jgi:chromosome segregation ATPase